MNYDRIIGLGLAQALRASNAKAVEEMDEAFREVLRSLDVSNGEKRSIVSDFKQDIDKSLRNILEDLRKGRI